jgi:hypothetical protein
LAYRAFQALAGNAGAADAAKDGRLRGPNIIPVQARNRKRLKNVKLEQFHSAFLLSVSGCNSEMMLVTIPRSAYLSLMRSVEDIEAEIEKLPPSEVKRLAEWLAEYQAHLWDEEIARDAQPGGRLRQLIDEAKADFKSGKTRPLP